MERQSGQTSVEYILLMTVMLFLAISVFQKLNDLILNNPDSMISRYLGGTQNFFGSPGNSGVSGSYRRFRLPR